jgi:hypothetical protein
MNVVSNGWISSALDEYRLRQMSIICFNWTLSALDEYHPRQMSIICFSWISSAGDEYDYNIANNRPQQMIFNREG